MPNGYKKTCLFVVLIRSFWSYLSHISTHFNIFCNMNGVFFVFVIVGLTLFMIFGDPSAAISAMLGGAQQAISLSVRLCAIYAVWLSVLQVMSECKIDKLLGAFFAPVCRKLFPGEKTETLDLIALNLSANLLGMGGAATPVGIQAIEAMQSGAYASDNAILFTVINTTSIQLIPATVIALRSTYGASAPSDILLPSLISTGCTTAIGIALCFLLRRIRFTRFNRRVKAKPFREIKDVSP